MPQGSTSTAEGARSSVVPFVGREVQVRTLLSAAAAAAAGTGALVLVGGEPGIGKTRLVEHVVRRTAADGAFRALRASCWEGEGVPAFWPWTQLVKAFARDRAPAEQVFHPPLTGDQAGARFGLFADAVESLRRAARTTPLLLMIDDLQWADAASLHLLQLVAPELPATRMLIVATYRDDEVGAPLRDLLMRLTGSCQRVELGGLSPAEVADLVVALTGSRPTPEQADVLHRRTNGNPLFLRELVRLMAGGSAPESQVPEGVRGVIQRRLARLSGPCLTLLCGAAVLGERFRLDVLQAMTSTDDERIADLLGEAADARLVELLPGAVPRGRFSHALVADVLAQDLGATRRRELHRAAAATIEELFRGDLGPRLARVAHHRRLAGDWDAAGDHLARAGERALGAFAYEEAAEHFERALEMREAVGGWDWARRCALLLSAAEARMAAGQIELGRRTYQRAAALARTARAPEPLARAALGVGLAVTVGVVDHLEIRLLEEALEACPDLDGDLRARLLGRLALALHETASPERRRSLSDEAVAMARRLGDPAAIAAALVDRHIVVADIDRDEDLLPASGEAVRLAKVAGDGRLELKARSLRIGTFLERGDMDAVRTELEICGCMTSELGMDESSWHLPLVRAGLAVLAGRLDEGERLAASGLRGGRRMQHPSIDVYHGPILAVIRYLQGRLTEMEPALRHAVERYPTAPEWRCGLALALAEAGRHEEARHQFEIVAIEDFAPMAGRMRRPYTLAMLALACDAVGDARRAERLHPLLAPESERFVQLGQSAAGCIGSAQHYLGLLCCAMSRWDEAVERFGAAIEANARIGALPFAANSRYQLARALRSLGGGGAQARARKQLELAGETARALGLRLWRGGADAPRSAPLSRREWEVARLVAEGRSNGEIAERLGISKRTVETHVDHVRNKLDLASRAAIVSWILHRP